MRIEKNSSAQYSSDDNTNPVEVTVNGKKFKIIDTLNDAGLEKSYPRIANTPTEYRKEIIEKLSQLQEALVTGKLTDSKVIHDLSDILEQCEAPLTDQKLFPISTLLDDVYKKVFSLIETPLLPTSLKKLNKSLITGFDTINSNTTIKSPITVKGSQDDRALFLNAYRDNKYQTAPTILSKSEFVPEEMVIHLMRDKNDSAIGEKYYDGDPITNMEGAMHTFITPLCKIVMTGDYKYDKRHTASSLDGQVRQVVLSAAIHPDFELEGNDEVVMRLVEVKDTELKGEVLTDFSRPTDKELEKKTTRNAYESKLQKHMVYHLTTDHKLPSKHDIKNVMKSDEGLKELNRIIESETDVSKALKDKYIDLLGSVVSLEALFNIYVHQIRNEFSVLESALPQGYVYTINPPRIFAQAIGLENVPILNRLQILAFKHLKADSFPNLKAIGFSTFGDEKALNILKTVFPHRQVKAKDDFFPNGKYSHDKDYALVVHNNSDAFGQNIETEGPTSLDGVIGCYSDAACCLDRKRKDLCDSIV